MSDMLKTLSYEQARLEFFREKRDEAYRKMEYWSKRAKKKPYLHEYGYLAARYGDEVSYYDDVVVMLMKEESA